MSWAASWTAPEYARHLVVKYDQFSVVPPEEISGLFTGAGLALVALLWVMAWVDRRTAATAGSRSAGVL